MRIKRSILALVAAGVLVLIGAIPAALAADRPVSIVNFSFSPAALAIRVGDSVTWTNNDAAPHTATSDTGVWDSGTLLSGGSFQRTFDQAGVYPYFCAIHPSMRGSILVGVQVYLPVIIT